MRVCSNLYTLSVKKQKKDFQAKSKDLRNSCGETQDGAVTATQDLSSWLIRGEVSQTCIFRLTFVAHRTGKFSSIKETRDTRQRLSLEKPAAGVAAANPTQRSPQGALVWVPC